MNIEKILRLNITVFAKLMYPEAKNPREKLTHKLNETNKQRMLEDDWKQAEKTIRKYGEIP